MYSINQDDHLKIMQGLQKPKDDGSLRIDALMRTGDCPFCKAEVENGVIPFVTDREHLQFFCKVCNFQGSPINYILLTKTPGKDGLKRAVEWLLNFIKE